LIFCVRAFIKGDTVWHVPTLQYGDISGSGVGRSYLLTGAFQSHGVRHRSVGRSSEIREDDLGMPDNASPRWLPHLADKDAWQQRGARQTTDTWQL
jgi:hypothetical protein